MISVAAQKRFPSNNFRRCLPLMLSAVVTVQLLRGADAFAANYSVATAGSSAWQSTTNWINTATGTAGTIPGVGDIAEFDANPTGGSAGSGFGFNFGSPTNNGTANQIVGAIEVTGSRPNALYIGPYANNNNGVLTLNGLTINGQSNTILANFDSSSTNAGTLNITNFIRSNTTSLLGVALAQTTNVVQVAPGVGSSLGDYINIASNISESSKNSSITVLGGGAGGTSGGVLELSGSNTFSGGVTAGNSDGSQGALLQVDAPSALPAVGNFTINVNSGLILNGTGANSYGTVGQTLTAGGTGATGALGVIRTLGVNQFATLQTALNLSAQTTLDSASSTSTLIINGPFSDNGFLFSKQGLGTIIFASGSNQLAGPTSIGTGTLIVNNGSSMSTGPLTLSQTSTNNVSLVLNNSSQTIGNLASNFAATTGTQTQIITLNNTALTINQTANTTYGNGSTNTLTSTITGSGNVTLSAQSTGTLKLSSANSYTGATTVNGGTLQVLASGALVGGGGVTVNNNGLFGGGGFVAGTITVNSGGSIFEGGPVSAIGTLSVGSSVMLMPNAILKIKLQPPTGNAGSSVEGTDADVVSLVGAGNGQTFTTGGATLQLIELSGSSFAPTAFPVTYRIVDATGGSNNSINYNTPFANLASGVPYTDANGLSYSVTYSSNAIDLTLDSAPTPEPGTAALIGIGLGAMLRRRNRKRLGGASGNNDHSSVILVPRHT